MAADRPLTGDSQAASVVEGPDDRTFRARLGVLPVTLHLIDEPAPAVHIVAPAHLGELVLPAGAVIAVSPVHLLRLTPDERRVADRAGRNGGGHA